MKRRRLLGILCLTALSVVLGLTLAPLWAEEQEAQTPDETAQNPPPAVLQQPVAPPKEKDPKLFPEFKDVTKDMGTLQGLFTLYRYDPSDKKRDPEKLLAKIPHNLLGQDLLFAMSISSGRMFGHMWGDSLIRFEVVGKHLKLVTPDMRHVLNEGQPVTSAVERTYNASFMAAVPIITTTTQGDVVIDLGQLLKSDLAGVSFLGGGIKSELSTWSKVKVFPDNVLIDVNLALSQGRGGNSVGVSYAFRRLPKLDSYTPRRADPRVGYFLTAKQDWSKKHNERETFERYIHRWQLEKQDPSLELSPPKQPIVFIIEKTVPIQWRRWIKEGIEDWNRAFEKIGIVDAIVVQQQTDNNEFADHDPEDARYNFLRWGVSGRAFAMGPSRVDPRTGQILDADIIFDDAFVRAWMYNFDLYGPAAMSQTKGPGFEHWLAEQPEMIPPFLREELARQETTPEDEMWAAFQDKLHEQGRCTCTYASGKQLQVALAAQAMIATGSGPKELPEKLIGEAIREIITHEVGHTLGLRHNFKASAWLSLDEIKRRRNETDEPTTASVMDYTPLLFFAEDKLDEVRHFVTPTIGPYDDWAIKYGYVIAKGKTEEETLKEITSHCAQTELRYATDQDTMWVYSPDPLVNRYDLSDDPIAYAQARITLTDKLLANILEWALQEGEPRYYLTRAFDVIWHERIRNLDYVARVVGGQYFNRDHQGDPDAQPPFVLVAPEKQRAALKYLGQTIFSDEFFQLDPEVLNMLAPSRWSHWGADTAMRLDYPIHDRVRSMQVSTLFNLMAPPLLQRLYDAELKTNADDKFTVAELVTTLRELVWPQLEGQIKGPYNDAQPFISSLARNLQREHLNLLLNIAQATPGSLVSADVQSMIRQVLRDLSARIGEVMENDKLDFATRAHLADCQSRIDRVLEAHFQAR
ncbi:MAG: zinc-dependent metalloprotease [Planctomycetota bacterium]